MESSIDNTNDDDSYQPQITAVADALLQRGVHFRAAVHNLEKAAKTHPYNTPKAKDLVELVHVRFVNIIHQGS